MSLRKALQLKTLFTSEQLLFIEEKKISSSKTPHQWIDFFEELVEFDELVDTARNKIENIIFWLSVTTVIVLIAGITFQPLLFLGLLLLVTALVFWTRSKQLTKLNIENRMREFVYPMIKVLKKEMYDDDLLHITADFKTGLWGQYLKSTTKNKLNGRNIESSFYTYPIAEFTAKLADKNELTIIITEEARKTNIGKYNARGKYKSKTKYKTKTQIAVHLVAKKTSFVLAQQPLTDDTIKTITGKTVYLKDKGEKIVLSSYHQSLSNTAYPMPSITTVLGVVIPCYSVLQPT